MKNISLKFNIFFFLILSILFSNDVFISIDEAKTFSGFKFQGEYSGQLDLNGNGVERDASIQVAVYGENQIRGLFITDQLPGETGSTIRSDQMFTVRGEVRGEGLMLSGAHPLRFIYDNGKFNAMDEEGNSRGFLERTVRESPTMGMSPPQDAVVLFDGTNLDHFTSDAKMSGDGLLEQGARTREQYGDKRLHVEAKLGFMPNYRDGNRANSGIYIQNRYEVQILDSFARLVLVNGNAALYNEIAPIINVSHPPLTWQTYDIYFRAPRFSDDGYKTENARFTVYLNGVLVHDNVELESGTGAGGNREEVAKAELYLQDHGDPVRFRNIWIVEGETSPPAANRLNLPVN